MIEVKELEEVVTGEMVLGDQIDSYWREGQESDDRYIVNFCNIQNEH